MDLRYKFLSFLALTYLLASFSASSSTHLLLHSSLGERLLPNLTKPLGKGAGSSLPKFLSEWRRQLKFTLWLTIYWLKMFNQYQCNWSLRISVLLILWVTSLQYNSHRERSFAALKSLKFLWAYRCKNYSWQEVAQLAYYSLDLGVHLDWSWNNSS